MGKIVLIASTVPEKGRRILKDLQKKYPKDEVEVVTLSDLTSSYPRGSILTTISRGVKSHPLSGLTVIFKAFLAIRETKPSLAFIVASKRGYWALKLLGMICPVRRKELITEDGKRIVSFFSLLKRLALSFWESTPFYPLVKPTCRFIVLMLTYPFKLSFIWLKLRLSGELNKIPRD